MNIKKKKKRKDPKRDPLDTGMGEMQEAES